MSYNFWLRVFSKVLSSFGKLKNYCFFDTKHNFSYMNWQFFLFEAYQTLFELKNQKYSIKEINVGPYGPFPSGNVSQKASQHLTNLGGEIFSRLDFPKTSKAPLFFARVKVKGWWTWEIFSGVPLGPQKGQETNTFTEKFFPFSSFEIRTRYL